MIAALGPPEVVPWVVELENGPDDRPIREQLIEHCKSISAYFEKLQAGLAVLHAVGITTQKLLRGRKGDPPPVKALRALTGWLRRAQSEGRLGKCDIETLAATILAALQNWAFTTRICGQSTSPAAGQRHVEPFIELLWKGIGGEAGQRS